MLRVGPPVATPLLLTVGAVVDPIARSRDPLTGGDAGGMANNGDDVTMTTRPGAQNAKTILGIVKCYALYEARQHLFCRLRSHRRRDVVCFAIDHSFPGTADGPFASRASLRHVKQSDEGAINHAGTMNHFSITYRSAGPPPGRWKAAVSSTEVRALFAPSGPGGGAASRFRAIPRPTRGRAKANVGLPCATSLAYYCVAASDSLADAGD